MVTFDVLLSLFILKKNKLILIIIQNPGNKKLEEIFTSLLDEAYELGYIFSINNHC